MSEVPFSSVLDLLRILYPPITLTHIGIVSGLADMRVWRKWGVTDVLGIDFSALDPEREITGERYVSACLASSARSATIVRSRLTTTDGLLAATAIQSVWPAVRDLRTETVTTTTLDEVSLHGPQPAWLIVDNLPAGETLLGGAQVLAGVQVLWVRGALQSIPHWPSEAELRFIDTLAEEAGLRCLAKVSDLDPRLGQAVYARDPLKLANKARTTEEQLNSLRKTYSALSSAHDALEAALAGARTELQGARATLALVNSEKDSISGALEGTRAELQGAQATIAFVNSEKDSISGALEGTRAELQSVQSTLALVTSEKDSISGVLSVVRGELAGARQAVDALRGQNSLLETELSAAKEAANRLSAERDLAKASKVTAAHDNVSLRDRLQRAEQEISNKQNLLTESEALCAELRNALVAHENPHVQLDEVRELMARAEGQLDLIKDLVGLRLPP